MISPLHQRLAQQTGLGTRLNPSSLLTWQLQKLSVQLEYARQHSIYYARSLRNIDLPLKPGDLAGLPFTPAAALGEYPQDLLCLKEGEIARVATLRTSGSSGRPKRVFFSQRDLQRNIDYFACGLETFTQKGDRVAIMLGDTTPQGLGDLLCRACEQIQAQGLLLGLLRDEQALSQALGLVAKSQILIGLPVQMNRLCYAAPNIRPRAVLLSADYVPQSLVQRLKASWHCPVYQHYGLTESGFGLAVQCSELAGFHLREAEYLLEIIDPELGQPQEPGQWGEVVLSSLANEAMPLIRYPTGDWGRLLPAPCPCGSKLLTLDKVAGRIEALGQRLASPLLEEAMFSINGLLDYQATWQGDELLLQVEAEQPLNQQQIYQALAALGLPPSRLKLNQRELAIFVGTAKRQIWEREI